MDTLTPTKTIRRVCLANPFLTFPQEEVEQSIPERFEQQVQRYPQRTAVKTRNHELTYTALNELWDGEARSQLADGRLVNPSE